jgi:Flp pilus assembly pilin Flp
MTLVQLIIERLILRDEGQDLLEYGLVAALIAIAAVTGITAVGDAVYTVFWQNIGQAV